MNCCDEYGQCRQGRDCPVHTGVVLPHQAAHAKCREAHGCASEGGNVWFVGTEPEDPPMSWPDKLVMTLLLLSSAGIAIAMLVVAYGYLYQTIF